MVFENSLLVMIARPDGVRNASSGPAKLWPGVISPGRGKRQTTRWSGATTMMRLLSRSAIIRYPGSGERSASGGRSSSSRAVAPAVLGCFELAAPLALGLARLACLADLVQPAHADRTRPRTVRNVTQARCLGGPVCAVGRPPPLTCRRASSGD